MILRQIATLEELETWYSFEDILKRNRALDLMQRAEARRNKPPQPK